MLTKENTTIMKLIYNAIAVLLLINCTLTATGQNSKVVSAYNYMKSDDLLKAADAIELAAVHESTMGKEKTWRYRALIYQLMVASENPEFRNAYPDAMLRSVDSYKRAMELDPKGTYLEENKTGIAQLNALGLVNGIEAFNENNFSLASQSFANAAAAASAIGVVDTQAVYNAGLAAERGKDYENALKYYGQAADYGYMGPSMYLFIANVYNDKEDMDGYLNAIQKGRTVYPENKDLIIYELNYYLKNDRFEEAERNLKLAIEADPTNKILLFSLGAVYDNLKRYEDAKAAYEKALEVDPNYFDANYNLGALIFNKGVELNNAANEIDDNKKYQKAKDEAKAVFEQAIPYLERAHEAEASDKATIQSLMQAYALVGRNDKYMEMKSLLED
jgi:tetratricopeptide (TPR) repeat protein